MAIEVAPAAVASVAYFFATGGRVDVISAALAGYGLLVVAAQLPPLPRYLRLRFSLGTWAFTFSWAAVASTVLFWTAAGSLVLGKGVSYVVLAAITLLIGGVGARSAVAAMRGTLLPPAPSTEEDPWVPPSARPRPAVTDRLCAGRAGAG